MENEREGYKGHFKLFNNQKGSRSSRKKKKHVKDAFHRLRLNLFN